MEVSARHDHLLTILLIWSNSLNLNGTSDTVCKKNTFINEM